MHSQPIAIPIKRIFLHEKKNRPLSTSTINNLAQSMSGVGLLHPISVKRVPGWGPRYKLLAGAHRLMAAEELGWGTIAALVIKTADAEVVKYVENLHRQDLSALERFDYIRFYERAMAKRGKRTSSQPHDTGVSRTARELDISRKLVQTARALGDVSPELRKILRKSGGDNNASLLKKIAATNDASERLRLASRQKSVSRKKAASYEVAPLPVVAPRSIAAVKAKWMESDFRRFFEACSEDLKRQFARMYFQKLCD